MCGLEPRREPRSGGPVELCVLIQVPEVVNDRNVTIAVDQLVAGLRLSVLSAPRM